jgi:hypothetical protein
MVRVASGPAAGQYSVDGTGTYTFNSADAAKSIQIRYIKLTGCNFAARAVWLHALRRIADCWLGLSHLEAPGDRIWYIRFLAKVANSKIDCGESGQLPNFPI